MNAEIRIEDGWLVNEKLLRVARSAPRIVGKCVDVEVLVEPVALAALANAKRLAGNVIGAVLILVKSRAVVALAAIDGKRWSGHCCVKSAKLPSAQDILQQHVRMPQFGKLIDKATDPDEGVVEAGKAVIVANAVGIADAGLERWIARSADIGVPG